MRKNKSRVPQGADALQRKKMGRRLDIILKRLRLEVGGGEAGRHTEHNDTKMLRERDLKLPKALKDMLSSLRQHTSEKSMANVTVVGMLQYGMCTRVCIDLHYQSHLAVCRPKDDLAVDGYTCILHLSRLKDAYCCCPQLRRTPWIITNRTVHGMVRKDHHTTFLRSIELRRYRF